jgi:DNA-binding IclR family transcriptional regulator
MEDSKLRYKTLGDFTRILSLFEEPDVEERGVNEIAKSLQMLPSKVSRMLKTLEADGWVERNTHTGRYRIGARFLQIGLLYALNHPMRRLMIPHLEQTARDLGLLTAWGIFRNGKVIVIDRFRLHHGPLIHLLGSNVPLHTSSYGKLFLAHITPDLRERLLETLAFTALTSRTIRDPKAMREELQRVREKGYAVDDGETREGVIGIGAPIFDDTEEMVAALSVSGSASEFSVGYATEIAYLKEKVLFISRQLGYPGGRKSGIL